MANPVVSKDADEVPLGVVDGPVAVPLGWQAVAVFAEAPDQPGAQLPRRLSQCVFVAWMRMYYICFVYREKKENKYTVVTNSNL